MRTRWLGFLGVAALAASATVASASHDHDHHGDHERDRAHGGKHERGRRARPTADPAAEAVYRKECGACHVAYAPDLLPPAAWRTLLDGLDQHFGQDAAVDDATRATLARWLAAADPSADASTRDAAIPLPRITEQGWFARKHRKIAPAVVRRASVGTMSNCAACHRGAADWDFDEHRVMIPD